TPTKEDPMDCVLCHKGKLRPIRMRITMEYDGKRFTSPILNAKVCVACGEQYTSETGAVFMLHHRNLAPNAKMRAIFTELVSVEDCPRRGWEASRLEPARHAGTSQRLQTRSRDGVPRRPNTTAAREQTHAVETVSRLWAKSPGGDLLGRGLRGLRCRG